MADGGVHEVLAGLDAALVAAGVGAILLAPVDRRKTVELLVRRRDARSVHAAVDVLPWRWRYGGDGAWRLVPRRVYRFDGGTTVIVHRALVCAPWPPGSLRRLTAALRDDAVTGVGVLELSAAATLVFAGVEAARDRFRSRGRLEALAGLAVETPDDAVLAFARTAGVSGVVSIALDAVRSGDRPVRAPSPPGSLLARLARGVLRRLPGRVGELASGQPVGHAVVRSRAGGIEVVAGPGVFLPRAVGDGLVDVAVDQIGERGGATVVEVGASCGAQLLPLARRRPDIRAFGTDIDPVAVRWARRNARRLRLPVRFAVGSLLDPLPAGERGSVGLVFANLPSIRAADFDQAADAPDTAYVGEGEDGLDLHRTLAREAREVLAPGGSLVLQMALWQWERFAPELARLGYEPGKATDRGVAVVGGARWPGAKA